MQLIQRWDSGQNAFMLGQRAAQEKTGHIIPQINEEYGYEDLWEKTPATAAAETRRKDAWEIAMAGCYQTTGESARTGTGVAPDTGGGWVNGRGDDSMTMLRGYGIWSISSPPSTGGIANRSATRSRGLPPASASRDSSTSSISARAAGPTSN